VKIEIEDVATHKRDSKSLSLVRAQYFCFAESVGRLADFFLSLFLIFVFDLVLCFGNFSAVRRLVGRFPSKHILPGSRTVDDITSSFADVSALYVRTVRCIQRSAALSCILRLHGVKADFVVGCRSMPFYGHAWVEVEGRAISEEAQCISTLQTLDRC
jgi:hypothetical protein